MEFIAIIGDPGSGKTNMLVKYLVAEHGDGTELISNLNSLTLPQQYMGFDDLIKACENDDPILQDKFVATDELGIGADSYQFLSKDSQGLTSLNAQRRKFHLRWMYTVQRWSMITRRLRLLTDGFISMHDPDKDNMFYPSGRRAKFHREVCQGIFGAEYYDRNLRLIPDRFGNRIRWFNGRKFWKYYDTDEKISKKIKDLVVPEVEEVWEY